MLYAIFNTFFARRDTACRVRLFNIYYCVKMVWHYHVLQNIDIWLVFLGVLQTFCQIKSYL